ncbi:glycoside hydrolase family 2 protein [Ructibacterium gallinarum]|uniref:Uncharacterized protein n=1 Tax=Ructibacterium gallinarum TaxID=2779355 RepID=A0A9D5LX91_9FIRM|nr:glycoside hydrolase family 2 TIM barrel-domain containing protein [Ructibacterium gallinarum]MBE5039528.1 hypothetical protein [Ructibacterium gallinarum]
MKYFQTWTGGCSLNEKIIQEFPADVPGNIQLDYAKANGFADVNWMDNCTKFQELEDYTWFYRSELKYEKKPGDRIYFVTLGIEYEYDVLLNGKKILHHIGMFSKAEADITDELQNGNLMEVYIYPHPKRPGALDGRQQVDQSCKPAVEYGWDWHPRLLVSGIWEETYIETRNNDFITACSCSYVLSDDLKNADILFEISCLEETVIEIYDMTGEQVYYGTDPHIHLENIHLWWCCGQGEAYLYHWKVRSQFDSREGRIGFREIRLVMNEGTWEEPSSFPKSRSFPPATIELNGRRIFVKGSNWVNPEIFTGTITRETYHQQIVLAKEANMNLLRCWGGAIVNKDSFFEICDEMGMMVWQEFPLACNNYIGTPAYLKVLEQEASAIILRLKQHPCLVLWCGGNELFNKWSKMTDQSLALRLLNKLCYELDPKTPFLMTSPLSGMAHGGYIFYDPQIDESVFETVRKCRFTAYCEFGIPSITEMEQLRTIFPEELADHPQPKTAWELHHGYGAWGHAGEDAWICFGIIDKIFGKQICFADYIEKSQWLQCEGLKCIFEEARRQKPHCSMAVNWCFNEPWITAAGQSIIGYPCHPKKAYYAVRDALRPVMPSARIEHFSFVAGEMLTAELWMLNDSCEEVEDTVRVFLFVDETKKHILDWNTGIVPANTNRRGHKLQIELPFSSAQSVTLLLESEAGSSMYRLLMLEAEKEEIPANALNM